MVIITAPDSGSQLEDLHLRSLSEGVWRHDFLVSPDLWNADPMA